MPAEFEPLETKQAFSISYLSRENPDNHAIDSELLAPALLAMSRLIQEANEELNGPESVSKVFIVSDFEHKCFNINYELLIQSYAGFKDFLAHENVKTAKEVLEWLGLLSNVVGVSVFCYLKWKGGRAVSDPVKSEVSGEVIIKDEEGNSISVKKDIYNFSQNPVALDATKDIFLPIGKDFDTLLVRDGEAGVQEISLEMTQSIIASCQRDTDDHSEAKVEKIETWLSVYSPVYDLNATKWRFKYGQDTIYADISETDIAKKALIRGVARHDDSYYARIEIEKPKSGRKKYKIVEVLKFVPGEELQGTLFE